MADYLPGWQVSQAIPSIQPNMSQRVIAAARLNGDHNNTYRLPGELERVSIGEGVVSQSETSFTTTPDNVRRKQSGYAVWSAQASYRIDEHWSAALNINNLFDKRYYLDALQTFYGEPQSVMLTLRGNF